MWFLFFVIANGNTFCFYLFWLYLSKILLFTALGHFYYTYYHHISAYLLVLCKCIILADPHLQNWRSINNTFLFLSCGTYCILKYMNECIKLTQLMILFNFLRSVLYHTTPWSWMHTLVLNWLIFNPIW